MLADEGPDWTEMFCIFLALNSKFHLFIIDNINNAMIYEMKNREMLGLPGLLSSAISSACESGRPLSWKIQEGKRGTLIQLIWEPQPAQSERTTEAKVKVGSEQKSFSASPRLLLVPLV